MTLDSILRVSHRRLGSLLLAGVIVGQPTDQAGTQDGPPAAQPGPIYTRVPAPAPPPQPTPKQGGGTSDGPNVPHDHPSETNPGRTPHESGHGAEIAGITAGIGVGALVIGEILAHHKANPEKLAQDGPQVPQRFDMNAFEIHGLASPSWPIVLDFALDGPGQVQVDIIGADKSHSRYVLTGNPNRRGYAIFRLPPTFGKKLQPAVYQVRALPAPNTNSIAARLRTYGMGAGEKAVGSVAIDQLTFQPAVIHKKIKEVAIYGFHTHSAFDVVNAEFIFTALHNGHLLVEKDKEAKLTPVAENTRLNGLTWAADGRPGEHMLEIRAWRGLATGGDWVVAWSPDIVDVEN